MTVLMIVVLSALILIMYVVIGGGRCHLRHERRDVLDDRGVRGGIVVPGRERLDGAGVHGGRRLAVLVDPKPGPVRTAVSDQTR